MYSMSLCCVFCFMFGFPCPFCVSSVFPSVFSPLCYPLCIVPFLLSCLSPHVSVLFPSCLSPLCLPLIMCNLPTVPKSVSSNSAPGSRRWANRPPAANTGRTSVKDLSSRWFVNFLQGEWPNGSTTLPRHTYVHLPKDIVAGRYNNISDISNPTIPFNPVIFLLSPLQLCFYNCIKVTSAVPVGNMYSYRKVGG